MIDKLSYEDVLSISKDLAEQANIVEELVKNKNVQELSDFAATVLGYSKFLETTVHMSMDADKALEGLKNNIKK